jgi:hypothetical protein
MIRRILSGEGRGGDDKRAKQNGNWFFHGELPQSSGGCLQDAPTRVKR